MFRTFTMGPAAPSRRSIRRIRQPWRWLPFAIRLRVARWRNAVLQRRVLHYGLRLLMVVFVVGLVAGASSRSRAVQERWGETTSVVVLAGDALVGERTVDVDWRVEVRPTAFVPADALENIPVDTDDVLVRSMRAGDVATRRDLRSTTPALVPGEGRRAVSVPLDPSVPALTVGDRVDLFLVDDVFGQAESDPAAKLGSPGLVLAISTDAVTLSIAADDVQALANTALHGSVIMALR